MSKLPATSSAKALAIRRERSFPSRLMTPLFDRIRVDPEAASRLQDAHARGVVVHVFRASRLLDPLYVEYAADRLDLPLPHWRHDHFTSRRPNTVSSLRNEIGAGMPSILFLKRPKTLVNVTSSYAEQHVEALVALQRTSPRPILLLPETLLWTKRATGLRRTIIDATFGDRDAPGWLREVLGFFWHARDTRFHVGAPVDIQAVIERETGQSDAIIARKIRFSILHHLAREEQIRTGPIARSAARTRRLVMNDPAVRRYIQNHTTEATPAPDLEKQADRMLRTIAADMRYGWLRVLDATIDLIWNRIYDGIVVDQEGLARVRRAARKGPVVLVPSHKSHVDYLVLSQVFFRDGMMPPHIVAGDNLNFWPMGHIFRRSGAFFIRRSFKGDKLYATVFAAYVNRLLKQGHALEFFIEGGRSRTGKLLPPRMGMLTMCVDPVVDNNLSDLQFIPVSISYEKIVEAGSYAKELAGGAKRKEDVTALLSSAKVLRSRYGRVYVDFAEPISLRVFAAARGLTLSATSHEPESLPQADRRNLVTQLGHRIVYGINEVTRVTPTSVSALVLLARSRRGLAETELYQRADYIIDLLDQLGARRSHVLDPDTRKAALREALGRFAAERLILMTPTADKETIYQVSDAGRQALDYYKNNILHFFAPYAIVALATLTVASPETSAADDVDVRRIARRISALLKFEFSFRDQAFDDNFDQAIEVLVSRRILERRAEEEHVRWAITRNGRPQLYELAGLIAAFFEAYRLLIDSLEEAQEQPISEKKLFERALIRGQRQVLEGRMQRAEALSKILLKNGLQLSRSLGLIESDAAHVTDEAQRQALVTELSSYLRALLEL